MGIEQIPVISQGAQEALTGNAMAILREVASLLQKLVDEGLPGAIDLSALPLTPADKTWLSEKLGMGEVEISLDLNGDSQIHETTDPGVWWVTHKNENGAVIGEFIEVTSIPDMVPAQQEDIVRGSESLNFLMNDLC